LGDESPDTCSDEGGNPFPCALSPQAVIGNVTFASISANTQHVCGLDLDRVAYCWGLGSQGQLGNGLKGTAVFSFEPVRVLGQP
jgi:alpha-tubulin suppressor-like RCC1 family protein